MLFRLISDIHLDGTSADRVLNWLPSEPTDKDTILLIAGDMCEFTTTLKDPEELDFFFEVVSARFKQVLYVMGNHDSYNGVIDTIRATIVDYFTQYPNVLLLDNETYIIDDIAVIGSTLWSSLDNKDWFTVDAVKRGIMDYHLIQKHISDTDLNTRKLLTDDTYAMHNDAVGYITFALEEQRAAGRKCVVLTHHAPSKLSVADRYKGNMSNGAFVTSLEHIMDQFEPVVWCHGHCHNASDYVVYETRVLCNPYGYNTTERQGFDPWLSFEV